MARDYTKYKVDGIDGVFGKGKLVLAVVTDYCSKNECTFDELKTVFPDEAQAGNTGVFGTLGEAKEIAKKRARHYIKNPIKLKDTQIAVSNQWGDNLPLFIETAKALGYDIYVAKKIGTESNENGSNEQSDDSSNEESSDQSFNTVEGITMIFRSMLSLDGEFTDDEAVKLVELVTPYVEYVGEELERVVANALKIYNANTFEQNFELVTSFSAIISESYSHEICVRICKDLATLAWADGELHENESKYWSHILKAMGVSADEVNKANEEATESEQSEESTNEESSTDQESDDNKFPTIPSHWGPEHAVLVPIRHCMLTAGEKIDETTWMNYFFEKFGLIGQLSSLIWQRTYDEIIQISQNDKYIDLLNESAQFIKENLTNTDLETLTNHMAEIVIYDEIMQYGEYITLEFFVRKWYSDEFDGYIEKFREKGIEVITSDPSENETSVQEEEAPAEQAIDQISFTSIPDHWGPEHVVVVPIRHCMVADGVVNQMEKNAMAHFFENFGEIGEASSNVWDSTDDEIMQIHSEGKYGELLADSAIYLKEHLDDDQLSRLIWYMAEIVSEDDIIQYPEFVTLKFYFDQWFPEAMDNYLEKFKDAGMTIITSPNN